MPEVGLADVSNRGLLSFDVEFGNASGFFSGARALPHLYAAPRLPGVVEYDAKLDCAELHVTDRFEGTGDRSTRVLSFAAAGHCELFDVVSRYLVIDTSRRRSAVINGVTVAHRSSNLYHQYPAGLVRVPVGADAWLEFAGAQSGMSQGAFEHVFYVRDELANERGNRWVVHHRIVATSRAHRLVLRGCNPRFEGPAPRWLNSTIPALFKRPLFRIRERRFPRFPFMVIGENPIPDGHKLTLRTTIQYHA